MDALKREIWSTIFHGIKSMIWTLTETLQCARELCQSSFTNVVRSDVLRFLYCILTASRSHFPDKILKSAPIAEKKSNGMYCQGDVKWSRCASKQSKYHPKTFLNKFVVPVNSLNINPKHCLANCFGCSVIILDISNTGQISQGQSLCKH